MTPASDGHAMNLSYRDWPAADPAMGRRLRPRQEPRVPRVGIITNLHSQRNQSGRRRPLELREAFILHWAPEDRKTLDHAMSCFAEGHVELIVIDGGDGTVREVMSAAHRVFGDDLPRFAILRGGKTNALALDLGIPQNWTLGEIIAAHLEDRVEVRRPIQIRWMSGKHRDLFGFMFGLGAYSRATLLAQRVHSQGWFDSLAVAITLSWALLQTMLGGLHTPWSRGDAVRMSLNGHDIVSERFYLLLCSTLRDLPIPLRPFGQPRDGLKLLAIKAPPQGLWRFLPAILAGKRSDWLEENGISRRDVEQLVIGIRKSFVVDGERFPGGNLTINHAAPIEFIVP